MSRRRRRYRRLFFHTISDSTKKFYLGIFVGILITFLFGKVDFFNHPIQPKENLNFCFSPHMKCEKTILKELNSAKSSIFIQAYSLTSFPIANILIKKHSSGIEVRVLADKGQLKDPYSKVPLLKSKGIPVLIEKSDGLAHNKIIIIDKEKVITGSYNFSNSANKRNSENLIVIKSKDVAKTYLDNWELAYNKSTPTPFLIN